jgi:hypothetical protein
MLDITMNDEAPCFKLIGALTAILTKANGDIDVRQKNNIVVNGGFDFICDCLGNSAARPATLGWIAIGTGAVAPVVTDTALGTELGRAASTYAHTAGTKVFTITANYAAGIGTGLITEAGVFNAATLGTMLDRVTFTGMNKLAGDTLAVTFTFTLS